MFTRIPTVLRSQEIIDKAFLKASKITEPYHPKIEDKIRKEIMDRVSSIEGVGCSHLDKLVRKFPSIEHIHPFYRDMIDLMFDIDRYKVSLSQVQWASQKIVDLSTDIIRKLKKTGKIDELNRLMREYYGRYSSIISSIDKDLVFLAQCRAWIKDIPDIETDTPTFLISGMPNVGKSSLLSRLTGTDPKIAPYPFTTQSIYIGYTSIGTKKIQIIDTPGILDRPMKKRNEMELKSILSLRDIRGTIIFLIDPSGNSGYSPEQQEQLYQEIKRTMLSPVIRVQSKCDLTTIRKEEIAVSAETGEGIGELRKAMEAYTGRGST